MQISPNSFFNSISLPTTKHAMNANNQATWDSNTATGSRMEPDLTAYVSSGSVAFNLRVNYWCRGKSITEVSKCSRSVTKRV